MPFFRMRTFITPEIFLLAVSAIVGVLLWLPIDHFVVSTLIKDEEGGTLLYVPHDYGWYTLTPNSRLTRKWGSASYLVCTDSSGFRIDCLSAAPVRPADFLF